MAEKFSVAEAIKQRRTIYQLNNTSPISDSRLKEILDDIVLHTPSAFNSQTTRLVVLVKKDHEKFWDVVGDILKAIVPEGQWEHTSQRIQGFRNGYGTVSDCLWKDDLV